MTTLNARWPEAEGDGESHVMDCEGPEPWHVTAGERAARLGDVTSSTLEQAAANTSTTARMPSRRIISPSQVTCDRLAMRPFGIVRAGRGTSYWQWCLRGSCLRGFADSVPEMRESE